jgi:hypothetical protein
MWKIRQPIRRLQLNFFARWKGKETTCGKMEILSREKIEMGNNKFKVDQVFRF